jgi:hypothetical protein
MLTVGVRSMYCTVHIWYVLYITWILLQLLTLMNYNKWSMICTVQYMDLTPPVNIDELQQVEYDMYCTIHVSYSTCWHWWITTSGVWYVLYNTWILLHLLTKCIVQYISYPTCCNSSMLTGGVRSMYCTVHIILHLL